MKILPAGNSCLTILGFETRSGMSLLLQGIQGQIGVTGFRGDQVTAMHGK